MTKGTEMKRLMIAALVASGLAAASLGLASPALAAPSSVGSVEDTLNSLKANGYKVIVNKVGSAPLSACTVAAVRPGRDITNRVSDSGGQEGSIEVVLYTTVYVDAKC